MFRHGAIFKNDKFFTWKWISRFRLNQFTWVKFVQKTDMTLSCSNNCFIPRANQKHVTPHNVLGNPRPFLMESNLKLSKILRLHWTIPDTSPELIQRIERRAYKTYAVRFGFCNHLIASSERVGRSELISENKLSETWNDPLSIHWLTTRTGLSKTVTLFNNLMHNCFLKNIN